MSSLPPLCGLVLAGGESRRMGRDKATLSYCGATDSNVHHIVDSLAKDGVNEGGVSVALRERYDHEKATTAQDEGSARERTVVNAENVACAVQGLVNIFA